MYVWTIVANSPQVMNVVFVINASPPHSRQRVVNKYIGFETKAHIYGVDHAQVRIIRRGRAEVLRLRTLLEALRRGATTRRYDAALRRGPPTQSVSMHNVVPRRLGTRPTDTLVP